MLVFLLGQQRLCCVYGKGEHFSTKCDKAANVNARKEMIKTLCSIIYVWKWKNCTKMIFVEFVTRKISICEKNNKHFLIENQMQRLT